MQTSVNPDLPTAAPAVVVDPQTTLQSSAGLPLSPSPPLGGERVINVNPSKRERVKFEGSPDPGEESDQSLTSTSSMRLDELTTHPHKKKVSRCPDYALIVEIIVSCEFVSVCPSPQLTTPPFPEAEEGVSEPEGTRHRQERLASARRICSTFERYSSY